MTDIRERYVATVMIESWLDSGLTASQVFLRWNAGGAVVCSSGVNSHGVEYDSCSYVRKGMNLLAKI